MVALVDGQPRTMNLKEIIAVFIKHRRVVVNRRTNFELRKARERAHILEGWGVALANIDSVIALIKAAKNAQEAKEGLMAQAWVPGTVMAMLEKAGVTENITGLTPAGYKLSPEQAQAILDLRLHRLTGLEQAKILEEYEELLKQMKYLMSILQDSALLMQVIRKELMDLNAEFGDARRTQIIDSQQDLTHEDLITVEECVVTLSHAGYVKTQPLDTYAAQRRGGKGKAATTMKDEDFVEQLLVASTHDTILCFSSRGKVYWLKVYQLPVGSRTARGRPIVNLLPLAENECITAILPLKDVANAKFIFMATKHGTVKKVELSEFARPRSSGLIALDLVEDDALVGIQVTDGNRDVMLLTDAGKAIRFHEEEVRAMGRTARGVRGIKLSEGQSVIALIAVEGDSTILTTTENGYGKRTAVSEFPVKGRSGQGVIAIQTTARNGKVVGAVPIYPGEEVMLISNGGTLVRIRGDEISLVGRNTQGVTLIALSEGEKLVGIQRVPELASEETPDENL